MSNETRGAREFDEDGFHEIQLSGKQLVFLCMATTVVSIVIFLCGVLVGRGVRPVEPVAEAAAAQPADAPVAVEPPAPQPEPHAATPPASTPPPSVAPRPDAPKSSAAAPAAAAPAAGAKKPAAASAQAEVNDTPPDELSYYDELSGKGGKKGAKSDAAKAGAPAAKTAAANPADAKTAAASATPAPAPAATKPAGGSGGGPIAVQVGALKSRADAEALARRLSGKGYAAYIVSPEAGGPSVFKVRVGNYTNADEAARVKKRLEQEEKLKPWIIR